MGKTNHCNHILTPLQRTFIGRHRLHFHPMGLSLEWVRGGNDYRSLSRTSVKIEDPMPCVSCILIVVVWHSLSIIKYVQSKPWFSSWSWGNKGGKKTVFSNWLNSPWICTNSNPYSFIYGQKVKMWVWLWIYCVIYKNVLQSCRSVLICYQVISAQ